MSPTHRFSLLLLRLLLLGLALPARANQPPHAVPDFFLVPQDHPLTGNVLANDSDPDGDRLTAYLNSGPLHGTLVLNADGSFTYTPASGYVGQDLFSYVAFDGVSSAPFIEVDVNVTADSGPIANPDSFTGPHDLSLFGNVLANDTSLGPYPLKA